MYIFILWMCLQTMLECNIWESVAHTVRIYPAKSFADCETLWKDSLKYPDPEGMKSYHKCQPIEEPI